MWQASSVLAGSDPGSTTSLPDSGLGSGLTPRAHGAEGEDEDEMWRRERGLGRQNNGLPHFVGIHVAWWRYNRWSSLPSLYPFHSLIVTSTILGPPKRIPSRVILGFWLAEGCILNFLVLVLGVVWVGSYATFFTICCSLELYVTYAHLVGSRKSRPPPS
jgi:hypothetical protein